MNKYILKIAIIGAGAVILIGALKADSQPNKFPKTPLSSHIPIDNNYKIGRLYTLRDIYNSAEELESYADLIVVGKTNEDFEQGQSVVFRNSLSRRGLGISGFYTLTFFEVKKVLKGSITQPGILVSQSAVLLDTPNQGQKKLLKLDGYTLLKKDSSYLLYLKEMKEKGRYSIISVNQGKFNIDQTDKEEEALSDRDRQYRELKSQVLHKHKSQLE